MRNVYDHIWNVFNYENYISESQEKFEKILEIRKKERFHDLYAFLKKKISTSQKKIAAINNDVNEAKNHLNDFEIGDFIFMNLDSIDKNSKSIIFDKKEIKLDPKRNLVNNAQSFYKRTKKAKTTIEQSLPNLERAKREFNDYSRIYSLLENTSEDGFEIFVTKAQGEKCERCWKYRKLGSHQQ